MLKDIAINSFPKQLDALDHLVPKAPQIKSILQNLAPSHLPWFLYFLTQYMVMSVTNNVSTT